MSDNDKKPKRSIIIGVVLLLVAAVLILAAVMCPIPIPVPADQTSPKVEIKAEEPKVELDPKVELQVITDPSTAH